MTTRPRIGQRVRWKGEVGLITRTRNPPARRIGGDLRVVGGGSVTILLVDGTRAPREATVPESNWDQLEILEDAAE